MQSVFAQRITTSVGVCVVGGSAVAAGEAGDGGAGASGFGNAVLAGAGDVGVVGTSVGTGISVGDDDGVS